MPLINSYDINAAGGLVIIIGGVIVTLSRHRLPARDPTMTLVASTVLVTLISSLPQDKNQSH